MNKVAGVAELHAPDFLREAFGLPWSPAKFFDSGLQATGPVGSDVTWKLPSIPYMETYIGDHAAVFGVPCGTIWFSNTGSAFEPYDENRSWKLELGGGKFVFTHEDGSVYEFDEDKLTFLNYISPGGERIEAVEIADNGFHIRELQRTVTEGAETVTDSLLFEFDDDSRYDPFLERVTFRRQGSWQNLKRIVFSYYESGDAYGSQGDLKTVTTQIWEDDEWKDTGTTMYRWYTGAASGSSSSSSSSSGGAGVNLAHMVKLVLNPAAYDRLVADSAVTDPLTASDWLVSQYADSYFEYDENGRVTLHSVNGGTRTSTFSYAISGFDDDVNNWKLKAVETRPDGAEVIIYSNFAELLMLEVLKDGEDQWITFTKYNSSGQVVLQANPAAVSGYDDQYADLVHLSNGNYEFLRDDEGLIRVYEYDPACGQLTAEKIKQGELGAEIKIREYEYAAKGVASCDSSSSSSSSSSAPQDNTPYLLKKETVYPSDTDQEKTIITSYCYSFHFGTRQVKERVTTLPAVPTEQNGSGVSATRRDYFDVYGNLTWQMDERGYITRTKYDLATHAVTQTIQDVDTASVSDEPADWSTPADGGLHIVTDYEHDDLGRITQVLGPEHTIDIGGVATAIRRATWTVYDEVDSQVRTAQGFATGEEWDTFTLLNPVSLTKRDKAGKVLEEIMAVRASTSGKLLASDTFDQPSYVRWSTTQYSDCCHESSRRVYHTIPSAGEGDEGTNYDQSVFGQDSLGWQNRSVSPGGTIIRTVFDVRGQATKIYVGTNDAGATESDPTGGGASGNNMVLVTEFEFDNGADGGDGLRTKETQHVNASETRVTLFLFDWRARQTDIDGEIDFYERTEFDNLDRITRVERYNTFYPGDSSSSSSSSSSGSSGLGNLIARSDTKYDDRGRVYQAKRHAVNVTTGIAGATLTYNTWFDAAGNVVKQKPAGSQAFTKSKYDSLGRAIKTYIGFDVDESTYSEALVVLGDSVFEQTESEYDGASNVTLSTLRRRLHDATGTGELTSTADSQPKARVSYVAYFHDAMGRQIAQANYGTNGDAAFTRPSTVPARSDDVLVISTGYNDDGEAFQTIDPAGKDVRTEADDAGRVVKRVENYAMTSSSSSSSSCGGPYDQNMTVRATYNADGLVSSIQVENCITGDQLTRYIYGTTLSNSAIARSDLLRAEIHPDSDDADDPLGDGPDNMYDRIQYQYNRQGQRIEITDENGTVHTYDFDKLGRRTQDRVTTLGGGVDGTVRRIATTYEVRGLREKVTSYDNATVGSGSTVNEVVAEYNDLAMLVEEYQEHDGTKDVNTPYVGYNYDETVASGEYIKGHRATSIRYPNGRLVHYTFGSGGSDADNLGRIDAIHKDNGGAPGDVLASYIYLGLGTVVIQDYAEPQVKLDYFGGTSGAYAGFDRFDRIVDHRLYNYGSSQDVDRVKYGYDRAFNRIWKESIVAASSGKDFDEFYTYDGLHRLATFDRGDLNGTKTGMNGTPDKEESWTIDPVGNWLRYIQNTAGATDLNQSRVANAVNEITEISETAGPSWLTPVYSQTGDMTTIPKPSNPAESFTATYDGWNRLVKIEEGSSIVAEYAYEGTKRRSVKRTYTNGVLNEARHFYYSETATWQVLEERVGTSSHAQRHFVWGIRYVDDLIFRERDSNGNGVLDERLYALQDASWNCTGVISSSGILQERYEYDAYGTAVPLTAAFEAMSNSTCEWEIRFGSYRWDNEVGFHQVRNRLYHALLGRWHTRDPLGLRSGWNLYEYADSCPTSGNDPSGLIFFWQGQPPETDPPLTIDELAHDQHYPYPYIPTPHGDVGRGDVLGIPYRPQTVLRLCSRPIQDHPNIGHLYIVHEYGNTQIVLRGGPGPGRPGCQCNPQLLAEFAPYQGHPDYVPPEQESCLKIVVKRSKVDLADCFKATLRRINSCCIPYDPFALGDACNSNCVVYWLIYACVSSDDAFFENYNPYEKLWPKLVWGWGRTVPDCISQPTNPRRNVPRN